jgi:murein L,D-transpeptidase YcbB/YkuD
MERWRWFSKEPYTDYIIVNIPQFRLKVIEDNHQVLNMRVVVGKEEYKTPIFDSFLEDMILNPYWYTSNTYNEKTLLPALKNNPETLSWRKIKVFSATNLKKGASLNPKSINWNSVNIKDYVFRQDPGNFNPMGDVKFTFENNYNIYLHDTNHRELFKEDNRELSTGCIRVEKPKMLAIYLFSRESVNYSYHDINVELKKGTPRHYKLKHGLPIFISYQTLVIKDKKLLFFEDIYNYDDILQDKIAHKL